MVNKTILRVFAFTMMCIAAFSVQAKTSVVIATVNNSEMVVMQRLSKQYETMHPDVELKWVVLEENVLRQRVTTDIATNGGQFDVVTIGAYEAPMWGKNGWLETLNDMPESYQMGDIFESVRNLLSYDGTLYAAPFYAESSMTYYRKDLFKKAGLNMPENPTYSQIEHFASTLHDPQNNQYGICLRGKAGWGENMAYLTTLVNTFGGRWFDEDWNTMLTSQEWKKAVNFYINILSSYGPPGASANGYNENRALFATGRCSMWIDATVAAGYLTSPEDSLVHDKVGFVKAPTDVYASGSNWAWSWALAIPESSKTKIEAKKFIQWATSQEYIQLVGEQEGWSKIPPGTRASTYSLPQYRATATFADITMKSIKSADPHRSTLKKVPYSGVQFVAIPEFQGIGTQVGQMIAGALAGQMSVEDALSRAQRSTERTMKKAGY